MSDYNMNGVSGELDSAVAATETFDRADADASRLFGGFDAGVPEAVRAMAERTVSQGREAYENTRDAMEDAVEALEKTIDNAGQGTAALNRKAIEIAQANLNTGFDLAKGLAGARNLAEIMELQSSFARTQFETLSAQAEEFRALSLEVARDATAPFTNHVSRSIDKTVAR